MPGQYFLLTSSSVRTACPRLRSLLVGVAMLAAFAVLFATAASAEGTLLAVWLWNGALVTGSLPVEISISLKMEDTKTIAGAGAVLCLAILKGSVGVNGTAEMTEILNPKGEKVGTALGGLALLGVGEGSECKTVKGCAEGSAASPIEVTPLGLPWRALLFQHETTGAFLLLLYTEGELGYELLCLALGISIEDKCTSASKDFEIEVANEEAAAAIPANAQTEPSLNCSQGGEASGKNTEDELTFIKPLAGGKLSVYSEGVCGASAVRAVAARQKGHKDHEQAPIVISPYTSPAFVPVGNPAFASPFGPATTSFAPQDRPSAAAMTVLMGRGLSSTRAIQDIEVQSEVAHTDLVRKIELATTRAFAGVWLDPQAAQFHIGVTSPSSRRIAERVVAREGLVGDVTMTPVRSTWAQLLAAQERWGKRHASLFAHREVMTAISSQDNALSVRLSPFVPPWERAVLDREAARESVNVSVETVSSPRLVDLRPEGVPKCENIFKPSSAFCEKTLTSGVGWQCRRAEEKACDRLETEPVGPQCTAGPMLIKGTETYMLTAGHCFGSKSPEGEPLKPETTTVKVSSAYPGGAQREIGNEGSWFENKERDVAEVKIKPRGEWTEPLPSPVPAFMTQWGLVPETPRAVAGKTVSFENKMNCHEGMTSGEQCGMVESVNAELGGTRGLVESTACSEGGDSGGPWFTHEVIGGNEFNIVMQGIHIGSRTTAPAEVKCRVAPFEEEVQTNENTELTGLRSLGPIKVGWEVVGRGIPRRTEAIGYREPKPGEFTLVISKAATTKEKVVLAFKPFLRSFYEPISTILESFKGQQLLTTTNEVRKPRVRGPLGQPLTKKAYTSTGLASTIETVAGYKLTCLAGSGQGEASGISTGTAKIALTGCEGFGGKCQTAGAAEGEIALSAKYTLAFVNGAKAEVGLLLELTEATIECGKNCEGKALERLKLRGTGIGPITPVDREVEPPKKFKVAFAQSRGVQSPTEYEDERGNKVKAVLEMEGSGTNVFSFEQTGVSNTEELLFEEAAEIES